MSTLTIRILESQKTSLNEAALRAGLSRMEGGKLTGNISALISLLAQTLPDKSASEIKSLLFSDENET